MIIVRVVYSSRFAVNYCHLVLGCPPTPNIFSSAGVWELTYFDKKPLSIYLARAFIARNQNTPLVFMICSVIHTCPQLFHKDKVVNKK